ncbi:MAG: thiamine-phosphate kinase [Rhodovibrionaceae bacterium]
MLGEFDLIAKYLAPLAASEPGADGLTNDAAALTLPAGESLVVTTDTMVEGVHYLPGDPAALVARKLLRVNLSDINAMGAEARGYLLNLTLPRDWREAWVADFAKGLAEDQETYGIALYGGDTTSTPGPTTLSLTALGSLPEGQELHRGTAKAGDLVCVSGTLGDGALGLLAARGELTGPLAERLRQSYRLPDPPMALGPKLRGLASAALDISDGLLGDLGHIARNSGLAARVRVPDLPLSEAVQEALVEDPDLLKLVLTGGDDYQLLFTLAPARLPELLDRVEDVTVIGEMRAGEGVTAVDQYKRPIEVGDAGWTHF